jgi:hypothetical protein
VFAGFRRRRNRRKPQSMNGFFSKVRRQLGIDKKAPVMLMELGNAQRMWKSDDQSWRYIPPHRQKKKPKMEQRMPSLLNTKRTKQRATVRAHKLSKKTTKYLAIGRNPWDREPHYLYLGPLRSETKRAAQFEAARMFTATNDILVLSASELSRPLRAAMASGKRVKAGVTRVQWPEVPPTFDGMAEKFVKRTIKRDMHGMIDAGDPRWQTVLMALHGEWVAQEKPWLSLGWFRKHIKSWRLDTCAAKPKKKLVKRAKRVTKKITKRSLVQRAKPEPIVSSRGASKVTTTASARKLSPRSTRSHAQTVMRSASATQTKGGRTPIGFAKRQTSSRSVRVAKPSIRTIIRAVLARHGIHPKTNGSLKISATLRRSQPRQRIRTRR